MARHGRARLGEARHGKARQGTARLGEAGRGEARQGKARFGAAGPGEAREPNPKPEGAPMAKLHPSYKEAARRITAENKVFYSDEALGFLLEEDIGTKDYEFARLSLISYLLDEYGVDFIRAEAIEGKEKCKGYKIATAVESVQITARRLQNRIRNAARKQRKVLSVVDPGALPEVVKKEYDARLIRGGLLASFLAQTPLKRCVPGIAIRVDRPKLIQR
jgi:hypothetical protein